MGSPSSYVILCEDKLHQVFVYRFLTKGLRVPRRVVRSVRPEAGRGAAEAFVRSNYAEQVTAWRERNAKAKTVLIVVLDADTGSHQNHVDELMGACSQAHVAPPDPSGPVIHLIPKRSIETWLAFLDGKAVDEEKVYKNSHGFRGRESECHRLVDTLSNRCKAREQMPDSPDSLLKACVEFGRLREVLQP